MGQKKRSFRQSFISNTKKRGRDFSQPRLCLFRFDIVDTIRLRRNSFSKEGC